MAELSYTTRGIRRRRNTDKWEITLSHRNPITGEQIRTFHTVEAKTLKQAERKRDALILDLERKGGALATGVTVREFLERFVDYKAESGTIEPSTVRSYRRVLGEFGLSADPYILGTQEPESHPYNPSILGKEFAAFCKMNAFDCTFHDLRHTFATMMPDAPPTSA